MEFEKNIFDRIETELNVAVICDILDNLGYRNQAMQGNIYPLKDNYKLVGKARTLLVYDVFEQPEKAYDTEIKAVDSLKPGDVVICVNPSSSNGFWGELMATAAIARGARGVIVDGAVRDIKQLKQLSEFKVFTKGRNPLDSKGRCLVADYDVPVVCDGVSVNPGDIVFADIDGIVVVPSKIAEKVFEDAFEKISKENVVRKELQEGKKLKDVFEKYHVL